MKTPCQSATGQEVIVGAFDFSFRHSIRNVSDERHEQSASHKYVEYLLKCHEIPSFLTYVLYVFVGNTLNDKKVVLLF